MDMTKTWESAFLEKILAGIDMAAFDPKDTEKFYLREMRELRTRADVVINTHYEGQGYMPVDLMVDIINQIKSVAGQKVAVFDRISALMMKMVGCDVTLFDKGAGFVNSGMKFDIVIGNPPFSAGNSGKGGSSIYQHFVKKAFEVSKVISFVTPGSFIKGKRFEDMRNDMDTRGVHFIKNIPGIFKESIIYPVYWMCSDKGTHTIQNLTETNLDKLFKKLTTTGNSFVIKSGKPQVNNGKYPDVTGDNSVNKNIYIDRVLKGGPVIAYCSDRLVMKDIGNLAVYPQKGGHKPNLFYINNAKSYSQNVMGIKVDDEKEFNNLKNLFQSNIYVFILWMLTKNGREGLMTAGVTSGSLKKLPAFSLSKSWTDEELYAHFGLTADEIALVETSAM